MFRYKCLTHQKDWLVGQPIPENIINSVQSSRRTLIVLSKDFIQSMWSKLEFRAAHAQALQDKTQVNIHNKTARELGFGNSYCFIQNSVHIRYIKTSLRKTFFSQANISGTKPGFMTIKFDQLH